MVLIFFIVYFRNDLSCLIKLYEIVKVLKLFLFVIFISFSGVGLAQSSCECDGIMGACNVTCTGSTIATCNGTWWGGCKCYCKEKMITDPIGGIFDLEEIEVFKDYLKDDWALNQLNNIIGSLTSDRIYENNIVIIDDKNKYQVIFNELKKLFNLLSEQEKLELNYKLS